MQSDLESGGRGARLGVGLVDHFFPGAFGLKDDFDEFAGGAFAAGDFGDVVHRTAWARFRVTT